MAHRSGICEESLAILVCTDKYLDHVVDLTNAAHAKGKRVCIFFTGRGVLLTIRPQFRELMGKASLRICDISFRSNGLHEREEDVPGLTAGDFSTQSKNAEMLAASRRYLVF